MAPYRVNELFREQPTHITRIVFRITPTTQFLDLYTLASEFPLSNRPATLQ
jgi:hypothetical protein